MQASQETGPRFDGVDVLRGISIIAVLLLHTSLRMQAEHVPYLPAIAPELFHFLFRNGNNGVTVFFAVSGFLITTTSMRRFGSLEGMRPRVFYRIRFARIAPMLLLVLAILAALHLAAVPVFQIASQKATLGRALFAALTFHLNWLEAVRGYLPPNWDVLWSLSVEEMFYLFFPLVTTFLLRFQFGRAAFSALLIAFIAAGPFARAVWTTNPIWQEKSYLGSMDAIAMGCICAVATQWLISKQKRPGRRILAVVETAGFVLLGLIALWPHWTWIRFLGRAGLDGSALALGTCLVIFGSVMRERGGTWVSAPVRWFGRHSYEVYLTHEFLVVWGTMVYAKWRIGNQALWFAVLLFASGVVGALAARYISEPLNRRLRGSPAVVLSGSLLRSAAG